MTDETRPPDPPAPLGESRRFAPEAVREIPAAPGCYLMRDAADEILYVGKAVNLRARVSSYFRGRHDSPKTAALVSRVAAVEIILTRHEPEALVLENALIKRHRPRYNINLKDDKSYPFIMLTMKEEFPRCVRTRTVRRDGSLYFGPYPDATAAAHIARTVEECFKLCRVPPARRRLARRACLHFDMGLCSGVCRGKVTPEQYKANVDAARRALRGSIDAIVALAEGRMREAALAFDYEAAALWRDRAQALKQAGTRQTVVDLDGGEYDAFAVARGEGAAVVTLFMVREGKLAGERTHAVDRPGTTPEILEEFLSAYYGAGHHVPARVVVPEPPGNADLIALYLRSRRGHEVPIELPGPREKELLSLAARNANYALLAREREAPALDELASMLNLSGRPERIECYDISNISGTLAVGARVVFENGRPVNKEYRRYRIRTVGGPDDYAMMREMLSRRFRRAASGEDPPPDLALIDGGPGHLACAVETLGALGLASVECAAIAKREEEIFRPGVDTPLRLPRRSAALRLLQRLRDEAHRFAIGYHRSLRGKALVTSRLEAIPGVGPKRVRALFEHFGSYERIGEASPEELALCPGIPKSLAAKIRAFFTVAAESAPP